MKRKLIISGVLLIMLVCLAKILVGEKRMMMSEVDSVETILWDCSELEKDSFYLSSIVSDYSLLQFETKDASLFGGIDKLVVHDGLVYLLDRRYAAKILIFKESDGMFVQNIGKIGGGPGEYSDIYDFSIDSVRGNIYILCNRNKIMTYTLDGQFVKEDILKFMATSMEYLNGKFYFTSDVVENDNLLITDINYEIIDSYFPNKEYNGNYRVMVHHFQKRNNEIFYHRFMDNRIYRIDSEEGVSVAYTIDFGTNALEFVELASIENKDLKKKMKQHRCQIKYFTETDGYAFIVFMDKGLPCVSIYDKDKRTSKSYSYSNLKDDLLNIDFAIPEYSLIENTISTILFHSQMKKIANKQLLKEPVTDESNLVLYHWTLR